MLTDEELLALTPAERSDLARRLADLVAPGPVPEPAMARGRHRFVVVLTVSCAVLVPWIIFLAVTLPHRYVASHWTLTWVGFDVALLISLAATAVLAWLGRQVMIVACFITATLLVCDAWAAAVGFQDERHSRSKPEGQGQQPLQASWPGQSFSAG